MIDLTTSSYEIFFFVITIFIAVAVIWEMITTSRGKIYMTIIGLLAGALIYVLALPIQSNKDKKTKEDNLLEVFANELEEHFDAEGYEVVEDYCEEAGVFASGSDTYVSCRFNVIDNYTYNSQRAELELVIEEFETPEAHSYDRIRSVTRILDRSRLLGLKDWDDRTKYFGVN